jgi:hypothetical protein
MQRVRRLSGGILGPGVHGVFLDLSGDPDAAAHEVTAAVARSGGKLVYVDCSRLQDLAAAAAMFGGQLPAGSVLASRSPEFLTRAHGWSKTLVLAYRALQDGELRQGPPCPFGAIELPFRAATAESIRRVHSWAKGVYVRASTADRMSRQWRRRGAAWLEREGVEMLVYAGS